MINYLHHEEIDFEKWDQAINKSVNGRIYGLSWYLDIMAGKWDALILDDYKAVFPLPFNNKVPFVKQIFQPFLCQQLGLFIQSEPETDLLSRFIECIPKEIKLLYCQLNSSNHAAYLEGYQLEERINYILDLNQRYDELAGGYSKRTRKNLQKAHRYPLTVHIAPGSKLLVKFIQNYTVSGDSTNSIANVAKIKALVSELLSRQMGQVRYVLNGNQCEAICLLAKFKGRITYLVARSTPEGRRSSAMTFLIDGLIREHENFSGVLDFEGSMVPGIAQFYQGFGAQPEIYYSARQNKLKPLTSLIWQLRNRLRKN